MIHKILSIQHTRISPLGVLKTVLLVEQNVIDQVITISTDASMDIELKVGMELNKVRHSLEELATNKIRFGLAD